MDYFGFDINSDFILTVDSVKMRWSMITIVHGDDYSQKP